MKKIYLILLIIIIIFLGIILLKKPLNQGETITPTLEKNIFTEESETTELPMEKARQRVTKKPFGIKISPNNSPISSERFSGYHTGVDYEIFKNEENLNIQVLAICNGKLLRKQTIAGYGGLLIQECELNNQQVTVIYGHIKISSVKQNIGDHILKEEKLAILGNSFSQETDNERKHLHLGIHKGKNIDIRGYVQNPSELNNWIDFEKYIKE